MNLASAGHQEIMGWSLSYHMNPVHWSPDLKIRCLVMIYGENYQSNPKCFELENMLNKKIRITDKKNLTRILYNCR